jgi:hypothetical protein
MCHGRRHGGLGRNRLKRGPLEPRGGGDSARRPLCVSQWLAEGHLGTRITCSQLEIRATPAGLARAILAAPRQGRPIQGVRRSIRSADLYTGFTGYRSKRYAICSTGSNRALARARVRIGAGAPEAGACSRICMIRWNRLEPRYVWEPDHHLCRPVRACSARMPPFTRIRTTSAICVAEAGS